ncbi:MAG: hypothetical protein K0R18_1669 [Bacillales bacterium]|jgi:hypothetical protein|nr:hypothetical protein [Bacillales bacterium]
MWCARCGRDDTELMKVMSTSRRKSLPMCHDDRSCFPNPERVKKMTAQQCGHSKSYKNKLQTV